jgi:hypothetical protein
MSGHSFPGFWSLPAFARSGGDFWHPVSVSKNSVPGAQAWSRKFGRTTPVNWIFRLPQFGISGWRCSYSGLSPSASNCRPHSVGEWHFMAHEGVFYQRDGLNQDLLWKITVPASERMKALRYFDKFNLNEFTLFDSEEGLLEMLATRVVDMRST